MKPGLPIQIPQVSDQKQVFQFSMVLGKLIVSLLSYPHCRLVKDISDSMILICYLPKIYYSLKLQVGFVWFSTGLLDKAYVTS